MRLAFGVHVPAAVGAAINGTNSVTIAIMRTPKTMQAHPVSMGEA
jgi:hypothetical protein